MHYAVSSKQYSSFQFWTKSLFLDVSALITTLNGQETHAEFIMEHIVIILIW